MLQGPPENLQEQEAGAVGSLFEYDNLSAAAGIVDKIIVMH